MAEFCQKYARFYWRLLDFLPDIEKYLQALLFEIKQQNISTTAYIFNDNEHLKWNVLWPRHEKFRKMLRKVSYWRLGICNEDSRIPSFICCLLPLLFFSSSLSSLSVEPTGSLLVRMWLYMPWLNLSSIGSDGLNAAAVCLFLSYWCTLLE